MTLEFRLPCELESDELSAIESAVTVINSDLLTVCVSKSESAVTVILLVNCYLTIFVTLESEVGLLKYMVNMRSQTKIFEYADLLALLAELKNEQEEMTKGQERMEVQEEMKDRFRTSQEKMKRQFQAHIESQV
uniref:Uncharacterized protein n=2 Tax=Araneus ventricosus TaxID=182803 RepID=A0A4Y2REK2_ARAVE|nr:hypothetical protein AVEN_104415-1 [Araneus ventricosus]